MDQQKSTISLTDSEKELVRRSAFGAIALVSNADPGFFSSFKESMAGSAALGEAPEEVQELLRGGGLPRPHTGSPEEVKEKILTDLRRSMQVLLAKAPRQARAFRDVVMAAVDRVAAASEGVSAEEESAIDSVRGALRHGTAGDRPVGDTASDAPGLGADRAT